MSNQQCQSTEGSSKHYRKVGNRGYNHYRCEIGCDGKVMFGESDIKEEIEKDMISLHLSKVHTKWFRLIKGSQTNSSDTRILDFFDVVVFMHYVCTCTQITIDEYCVVIFYNSKC